MVAGVAVEESHGEIFVDVNAVGLDSEAIHSAYALIGLNLKSLVRDNSAGTGCVSKSDSRHGRDSYLHTSGSVDGVTGNITDHNSEGVSIDTENITSVKVLGKESSTGSGSQVTSGVNTKNLSRVSKKSGLLLHGLTSSVVSAAVNLVEGVPLIEVLATGSSVSCSVVILNLHTNEQVLNGPLHLLEKDRSRVSVGVEELLTVDPNQRETDTANVNLMQLYRSK